MGPMADGTVISAVVAAIASRLRHVCVLQCSILGSYEPNFRFQNRKRGRYGPCSRATHTARTWGLDSTSQYSQPTLEAILISFHISHVITILHHGMAADAHDAVHLHVTTRAAYRNMCRLSHVMHRSRSRHGWLMAHPVFTCCALFPGGESCRVRFGYVLASIPLRFHGGRAGGVFKVHRPHHCRIRIGSAPFLFSCHMCHLHWHNDRRSCAHAYASSGRAWMHMGKWAPRLVRVSRELARARAPCAFPSLSTLSWAGGHSGRAPAPWPAGWWIHIRGNRCTCSCCTNSA